MKTTGKLIIFIFTFMALAASAYAQSPREELKQMVEQLQQSPNDNALREKIITLAQGLKPAPAIPEEAERHMAYGAAAFKDAKSPADYKEAAKEFEQATLAAPWVGDAYFNLGVAQDKAESYEAALRSLNLARLASPDSKDIKALIYEVEYRKEKALAAPRAPDLSRLQGTWVQKDRDLDFYLRVQVAGGTIRISAYGYLYIKTGKLTSVSPGYYGEHRLKSENGEYKGVYVVGSQGGVCAGRESPSRATISADGFEMTVTTTSLYTNQYEDSNNTMQIDKVNCRYSPQPERGFVMRKQ